MDWARFLAYVTGTVDQELLARNEYLAAENRIMKEQLEGRLKLSDVRRKLPRAAPRRRKRALDFSSFPSAIYIRNRQKIGDFPVSNEFRTTLHTPI